MNHTSIDWRRAHLLALASQWAYREESEARRRAAKEGNYSCCEFFQEGETRGLVASNDQEIVVAFRGSVNLENWLRNFTFFPVAREYFELHSGFNTCFQEVRAKAWELLWEQGVQAKPVWVTGHSLGGALATVLAADFSSMDRQFAGIYTFGQPCAGSRRFADYFNGIYQGRCFRFVHGIDLVSRLPPGYAHVHQRIHLGAELERAGEELMSEQEFERVREELAQLPVGPPRADSLEGAGLARGLLLSGIPGLADHNLEQYIQRIAERLSPSPEPEPEADTGFPLVPAPELEREPVPVRLPAVGEGAGEAVRPAGEAASIATEAITPASLGGEPSGQAVQAVPASAVTGEAPVVVHVLWSPGSRKPGICPGVAQALFEFLCHRPGPRPDVELGVNIPVYPGHHLETVKAQVARGDPDQILVIVLLLDAGAMTDPAYLDGCRWFCERASGGGPLVIPVYLDGTEPLVPPAARPFHLVCSQAAAKLAGQDDKNRAVCRDVGKALSRRLRVETGGGRQADEPVRVFVNCSQKDLAPGKDLAPDNRKAPLCWLRERLGASVLADSLKLSEPEPGRSGSVPGRANRRLDALSLALRTDAFADDTDCQSFLLACKRVGMPAVTIQVLKEHERRSLPYGGNSPTLVWNPHAEPLSFQEQAERILDHCLQAWLKHLHFHHAAPRIFRRREFPFDACYLSRPPELLDFAQGTLTGTGASVVLYPDPPLPVSETNLIRHSFPRVRFATPTTLSGEILRKIPTAPLRGTRVVLSLSRESPDLASSFAQIDPALWGSSLRGPGLVGPHLSGAIAHLTLSLIRAGAELAYGALNESYTQLLSDLAMAHRRYLPGSGDAASLKHLLHCYVAPFVLARRENLLPSIRAELHRIPPDLACPPATTPEGQAAELSRVRHVMAQECGPRVIMGGRTEPRGEREDGLGYAGRFPGQVEEVFQQLQAGKPLYVIGGFGGVSALVARALQGDRAGFAAEATLRAGNPRFDALCRNFDLESLRTEGIALPDSIDALWEAISSFGRGMFWDVKPGGESAWVDNGLTREENLALFQTIHSDEISALVLKGLLRVAEQSAEQPDAPLHFSLFNGSITEVLDTEAYAVLVLGSAKLRGADRAIDERLGGALRRHLEGPHPEQVMPIQDDRLSGSFIIPEWIGDLAEIESLDRAGEENWYASRIAQGMRNVVERARKNGIRSFAMVPFGVNLGLSPKRSAEILVQALLEAKAGASFQGVTLCEHDPDHYAEVLETVQARASAVGDRRMLVTELPPKIPGEIRSALFHSIRENQGKWIHFMRSPGAGGAVPETVVPVDWSGLEALFGSLPPPFPEHDRLGKLLADRIFGTNPASVQAILDNRGRLWDVLHDPASSVIPFELLAFELGSGALFRPALAEGIRHGLFTQQIPTPPPYQRKGSVVRLLLVADSRGDLPGAVKEAEAIRRAFEGDRLVETTSLTGPQLATKAAVLDALSSNRFDLVHYAGHGRFDPENPDRTGLLFPNDETLTGADLGRFRSEDFDGLPLLVVLNACEVGRVDDIQGATREATSLAHRLLCAGIRGFVANRWQVSDSGAAAFAISLYRSLANGQWLGGAVRKARKLLFDSRNPDWANHMLYGSHEIHL